MSHESFADALARVAGKRRYAAGDDSWEEPFHTHLDAHPDDHAARRDFADHLDEYGDPRGEAFRWLADRGKRPTAPGGIGRDDYWDWWRGPQSSPYLCRGGLPEEVWQHLGFLSSIRGIYRTRRSAEDDFANAYHKAKAAGWNPSEA